MKVKKSIYELDLHESIEINNGMYLVTRVARGWIYCRQDPTVNIVNPVYVPFK